MKWLRKWSSWSLRSRLFWLLLVWFTRENKPLIVSLVALVPPVLLFRYDSSWQLLHEYFFQSFSSKTCKRWLFLACFSMNKITGKIQATGFCRARNAIQDPDKTSRRLQLKVPEKGEIHFWATRLRSGDWAYLLDSSWSCWFLYTKR